MQVFSILCGFTLGEYVRNRRLSLAGSEIVNSGQKIIDIALKYGYDTPESFGRAFTRFHGISPSQVKNKNAGLKSFSRLSVKLILSGGNTMDYRIETKKSVQLIMRKKKVSGSQELTAAEIAEFWRQCSMDGTIESLCKYISEDNIFGGCVVGASFGTDASEEAYPYAIGVVYNGAPIKEENLVVEEIPAHTYVVFRCAGKMPEAFQRLYQQISSEFFPSSEYQPCGGTDFEAYPSTDISSPEYCCEIWVAVEKK
ncbi:effector binding domain-containing protein [Clostridium sp. AM58-1XD]|uniref:AraC family transcriptional regulator n=1 Tax=Clostridium sp. AM58-1XD TaxID=2292307 RepID=UPI001FA8A3A4|nr:effector binding domain-containing protein [Clostridium sp. AM58-1XD]